MQARIGGLLAVSGFTLAFVLGAGWAMVAGSTLLVLGGLLLAVAAEPMLDLAEEHAPVEHSASEDATGAIDSRGGVAA